MDLKNRSFSDLLLNFKIYASLKNKLNLNKGGKMHKRSRWIKNHAKEILAHMKTHSVDSTMKKFRIGVQVYYKLKREVMLTELSTLLTKEFLLKTMEKLLVCQVQEQYPRLSEATARMFAQKLFDNFLFRLKNIKSIEQERDLAKSQLQGQIQLVERCEILEEMFKQEKNARMRLQTCNIALVNEREKLTKELKEAKRKLEKLDGALCQK